MQNLKQNSMKFILAISLSLFLFPLFSHAQVRVYEATFNGGVVGAGYSPIYNSGGTGTISWAPSPIPAGSTVRQAYLLAGRHGNAANITVTLDTIPYTFSNANQVSPTFQSPSYGGNSGVHMIDVTAHPGILNNTHTLVVPNVAGPSNRYNDFYLYVAYNYGTQGVSTAIFVNTNNFGPNFTHTYNFTQPLYSNMSTSLGLFAGYICDSASDGHKVRVNGILMTTGSTNIGGNDVNSGVCGGPIGSFRYQNSAITALSDDNINYQMLNADALSNVQAYMTGSNSFTAQYSTNSAGNSTNAIWGAIVAYGYTGTLGNSTPPMISTLPATNISQTSAVLNGNKLSLGFPIQAMSGRWFQWGTISPLTSLLFVSSSTSTGPFSGILDSSTSSGLVPNTQYYYKACGGDFSNGPSSCGDPLSFTTLP